ncbi:MAG: hypothetical protein HXX14_09605 [Bacteroidetes bacterium]|nr:hypothetical protein [Bacteroidota bacterium]
MAQSGENNQKIRVLNQLEWAPLFELIPEIEATEQFGEMVGGEMLEDGTVKLPYFEPAEIVSVFAEVVISLDLVPGWNWVEWEDGDDILCNEDQDYEKLRVVILCQLLILIVRADEFDEGFMVSNFEDGTVLKILKALQRKIGLILRN